MTARVLIGDDEFNPRRRPLSWLDAAIEEFERPARPEWEDYVTPGAEGLIERRVALNEAAVRRHESRRRWLRWIRGLIRR